MAAVVPVTRWRDGHHSWSDGWRRRQIHLGCSVAERPPARRRLGGLIVRCQHRPLGVSIDTEPYQLGLQLTPSHSDSPPTILGYKIL